MRLYLNAGNGGLPMGDRAIRFIKDHLFDGTRVGIPIGLPSDSIDSIVRELAEAALEACFIVGGWDWWTGHGFQSDRDAAPTAAETMRDAILVSRAGQRHGLRFYVELGNEPNLSPPKFKKDPEGFAGYVNAIAESLAMEGGLDRVSVISGGVSNINPWEGLPYLEQVALSLAPGAILGAHPYRMGNRPKDNLGDRPIGIIADRVASQHSRFALTEGGWHTAPRRVKRDFPLCLSFRGVPGWTDDEVAEFSREELDIWEKRGPEFYVWYQLNDGPDPRNREDRFGIRVGDTWEPKPVALALKEWRAAR